ncbi:hypothetical protein BC629DRAFT_1094609 [Irpex lacteus]|nr:hypothetical protein BC629DRAFT_1094609 [Irpex lacteus]
MRPWTEDYLVPKIMAVATPAGLCKDISVRAFYSGAHLTLLNGTAESNCIGIPTHLLNGRLVLTPAQSPEQFEQAWIKACSGLRSDEADVVFFPISSDIISEDSEELRLLRNLLFTLPHNLRHPRMQPSIVLIDNHSNLSTRHDRRRLENILKALVEDIWRPTEDALSNSNELFSNFVLVQPGGWFSWNRIRVYYWKTLDTTRPSFQQTPHLVAPDDVLEFVLNPPKRGNGKESGLLNRFRGCFGIDDPTLLAFVATQAALTACAAYKLACS